MTSSHGVRFSPTKEASLDPALRNLAQALPQSTLGVAMIAEMPGPSGIPDLVALPNPGAALTRRLDSKIPAILSRTAIEIVASLKVRQGITLKSLQSRVPRADRTISQSLRHLIESGAIIQEGNLLYRAGPLQPVGNLYALEAKVDDWRKGIRQAFRYQSWCSASSLVLSRMPKNSDLLISTSRRLSIGLALEDRWIVRPRISRIDHVQRLWGSEHFIAALGFAPTKSPQL